MCVKKYCIYAGFFLEIKKHFFKIIIMQDYVKVLRFSFQVFHSFNYFLHYDQDCSPLKILIILRTEVMLIIEEVY